jgi:hypothetical protein
LTIANFRRWHSYNSDTNRLHLVVAGFVVTAVLIVLFAINLDKDWRLLTERMNKKQITSLTNRFGGRIE